MNDVENICSICYEPLNESDSNLYLVIDFIQIVL